MKLTFRQLMGTVAFSIVLIYIIIKICAFFGIGQDVYGFYLAFFAFIILSLMILPSDYMSLKDESTPTAASSTAASSTATTSSATSTTATSSTATSSTATTTTATTSSKKDVSSSVQSSTATGESPNDVMKERKKINDGMGRVAKVLGSNTIYSSIGSLFGIMSG